MCFSLCIEQVNGSENENGTFPGCNVAKVEIQR